MQQTHRWKPGFIFLLCLVLSSTLATTAQAQPSFSKVFNSNTIGPGGTSRLTFTINNAGGGGLMDLAFTDNFPAAITLATPADLQNDCGGTLNAPDGGSTLTLTDGVVAPGTFCTISVNVTSSTVGTHTNTTGDLTSAAGNSGPATADLIVATDRIGFTKSFSPSSISAGSRSTLTFTLDNSANTANMINISFSDTFPVGMTIADPANIGTTCGGTLTAASGTDTFSYLLDSAPLAAGATCTLQVDVIAASVGTLVNTTSELNSLNLSNFQFRTSGFATASLEVTSDLLNLIKEFVGDPTVPGGTVSLEFTVQNRSRTDAATNITFTDDLDATLSGLVATGLPISNVCGAGSQISGTSLLTLTGGNLPAGDSCTFSVTLQVPAGTTPGVYPNTTSAISGDVGGSSVVGGVANDSLSVFEVPTLSKAFLSDPVGAGSTVTVEFTITNTSSSSTVTDMSFSDAFADVLSGADITSLPAAGFCGAGSIIFEGAGTDEGTIFVSGANLAPSASCTFQVDVLIPVGTPAGTYTNTTSLLQATIGADSVLGPPATDTITVIDGPSLSKSFTDDPVSPGDTVTLEFTLEHDAIASADATSISFTDDLNATLTGLTATGLPLNNICGTGSQISGTTNLSFTGGTLSPGSSCTFSVTLQVPMTALPGEYDNTTSNLVSVVSGETVISSGAADTLQILGLSLTKTFIDNPSLPGELVSLEFTIDNTSTVDATGMFFTDNLSSTLSGLVAATLPANGFCGTGSTISGPTFLVIAGANLTAGTSCTFTVGVVIPAGAADGDYLNTTSNLTATVGGSPVALPPAADTLTVTTDLLQLTKTFTDDPVMPGSTVTLEFTLTNLDATNAASAISFTDDLDATLSGLVATGLPQANICGAGSTLSGAGLITLTGGQLAAGGSCTFSVTLQLPASTTGAFLNTTSDVSGTINLASVTGGPASDTLDVQAVAFSKSFDGPSAAGRTAVLTFQLQNQSATDTISALGFTDDLSTVIPGMVAVGLPLNDVCGVGSQISGTSLLALTGGSLLPGGTCTINVTVQVPATATGGTFPNTTSDLFSSGLILADPATADLIIEPPPAFSKSFAPTSIGIGQTSTLTLLIDNTANTLTAGSLDFTDNLPTGMVIATPSNASTTCTGGTVTAAAGSGAVSYTGGSVAAGSSCTVSVDVTPTTAGALANTSGDLTSDMGNSGTASDTLTVNPQPLFSKAFAPAMISIAGTSVLTFTIDNTASTVDVSALSFIDNLPTAVVVATPSNASTTCTGGTLTAADGSGSITYTGGMVAAGATCTVQADVTSSTIGMHANTSAPLTSSLGSSGIAMATLTVNDVPGFAKAFAPDMITLGGVSTLTFTIDNTANVSDATALDFTDNLPTGVTVATPANASTTCTGGTVTAADGSGTISYTGGTVSAGSSCTVQADVTTSTIGMHVNTSGDLTSSLGNSGTAMATLTANDEPGFAKVFAPDMITLGGVSTLTFTIDNTTNVSDATALDFTDNLPTGVTVATPANASTTCTGGMLTAADGSGNISYTGGTVTAGSSCTVQADVTSSTIGMHLNTSGDLTSSLGNSGTAMATLTVNDMPAFSKAFAPDMITLGGISTLTFTIDNTANVSDATALDFTDTLPAGVTVATPSNASTTCTGGTLTAVDGSGTISYSGGTATAGSSCTVQADVTSSTIGMHVNTSGDLTSSLGNSGPSMATLTVNDIPTFAKAFAPDTIPVGGTSTLTFTIDNTVNVSDATALDFTDALPAAVTVASPASASTTCTGGTLTAVDGSGTVSYTAGSVAAAASCTIQVDVTSSTVGSHLNTSGDLTSSLGNSGPAMATLNVTDVPVFSKAFAPTTIATGGISTLTFMIDNTGNTVDVTSLDFTDPLPTTVTVASPANASTTCTGGTLTATAGSGVITYTGGTAAAGGSCTVQVDITGSTLGTYVNTSGDLTSSFGNSGPAMASLEVSGAPIFSKVFDPSAIAIDGISTLIFTIDNAANPLPADSLEFTDNLPASVVVATPDNASSTCGGTLTATSGSAMISLTGGTVAASASCLITVDVISDTPGDHVNTSSDLSSTLGISPAAMATLTVAPPATFTKSFAPTVIMIDDVTTLTFTIDNTASTLDATGVGFMDNLPAGMLVADPANASTTCTGGTLAADPGTATVGYTGGAVPAGAICTVQVDVIVSTNGSLLNVTEDLTSSLGNSGPASATLTVQLAEIEIPTLGHWGMMLLSALLAFWGVRRLRKH